MFCCTRLVCSLVLSSVWGGLEVHTRVFMANEMKKKKRKKERVIVNEKSPVVLFLFGVALVDGDLLNLSPTSEREVKKNETIFLRTGTDVMCK